MQTLKTQLQKDEIRCELGGMVFWLLLTCTVLHSLNKKQGRECPVLWPMQRAESDV